MNSLEQVFGRSPRVRMVEAILRLAPDEFTRPEAASEAGLFKASANRILSALEKDGLIEAVSRSPVTYRARGGLHKLEILSLAQSALRLAYRNEQDPEAVGDVVKNFQARLDERSQPRGRKRANRR